MGPPLSLRKTMNVRSVDAGVAQFTKHSPTLSSRCASIAAKIRRWMSGMCSSASCTRPCPASGYGRRCRTGRGRTAAPVAVDEIAGLARESVGEIGPLVHGLAAAQEGIVGVVIRLAVPRWVLQTMRPSGEVQRPCEPSGSAVRRSQVVVPSHGGGT